MKWESERDRGKNVKNICSVLLVLLLVLRTGLPAAGANDVVKDSGTEECVEIQLPVEKQQQFVSGDDVISVSMPLQTPFTMNPTKSFGEEQIWSPVFHFQNNSRTEVEVTVRNIRYVLRENSTVVTHYLPFDRLEERKKKEIYLYLRFGGVEVPVGDLSREYRFTLEKAGEGAGSVQEFSIEGMMSCYPEEEWLDGDVSIAFQVEYKAVAGMQTEAGEKTADNKAPQSEGTEQQAAEREQAVPEKTGVSLAEVKGLEWQKDLVGAVLAENKPVDTENGEEKTQTGIEEKENVRAYIIDSGQREQETKAAAQKEPSKAETDAQTGEKQADAEEFPFDWKKILDDYGKYADAIPEGAVLLLDVNRTAKNPAAYVTEEDLKNADPTLLSGGGVYAFWKNPDYISEENKVWHIEEDVPYYISNPEQPWLWSAADGNVPSDAEPVFLWIRNEYRTQSSTDASQQTYQDTQNKEGNAEYGPGNNTGDTTAE